MNHRAPHYFTSVPANNTPSQPPCASKACRPPTDQTRVAVLESPCQWSRAATASPSAAAAIQLSRRRLRTPPVWTAAEDCVAAAHGSPKTFPAPADWSSHPSAAPHHPRDPRHLADRGAPTASDRAKRRRAHSPPGHAKMRRLHREEEGAPTGRTVVARGCPSDGVPRRGAAPSTTGGPAPRRDVPTASHSAVRYPHGGGLAHPVAGGDDAGSRAGATRASTENSPGRSQLRGDASAHSYGQRVDPHHAAAWSRPPFSRNNAASDPPGRGVAFAEMGPSNALAHAEDNVIQRHRHDTLNEEAQILSQNKSVVGCADPSHPYLSSVSHFSLECRQKCHTGGFSEDAAKNSIDFLNYTELKISRPVEEQRQGIDSSFPDYHKLSHCYHSISSGTSASIRPLTSFQRFPSHLPDTLSQNEPHRSYFTGGSLRESYEFNRHLVAAFDLTTSRSVAARDAGRSKMYPTIQTQSDITNSLYAFSHKYFPEPSNAEAFDTNWHEKVNQQSMHIIPTHTSILCPPTNLDSHAPSSINLCYSGTNEVHSDITNTKASMAVLQPSCMKYSSPQIKQPDKSLIPHNLVPQNFAASYNSLSGALDKSRNPTMLVSSNSRGSATSTLILSHNTGLSSIIERNKENEDRDYENRSTEQSRSILVNSSQKKYMGTCHSSQLLSTEPQSETNTHRVTSNTQRRHISDISHDISKKEFIPQPNIRPHQLPHCSSKSKISADNTRRRRRHAVGLICGVCGDSARSLHFGGVSCDSCKAFFRRAVIARAYPSFLCVTTSLPPKIKCQKGEKRSFESSKPSDIPEVRLVSTDKDSSRPNFTSVDPHKKVQSATNSGNAQTTSSSISKSVTEGDGLSYNDNSVCSIPKDTTPGTNTSSFQDGNSQFIFKVCHNTIPPHPAPDTPHPTAVDMITVNEKCSSLIPSGSKQSYPSTNAKDPKCRLGSKQLVKCPPITITTRKYCQACRFQRCIDIGMEISWVTLENDAHKNVSKQQMKNYVNRKDRHKFRFASENSGGPKNEDMEGIDEIYYKKKEKHRNSDLNEYLTRDEQQQIEDLVDIYRSVFWGVPEPSYYRPALIDFPPPFATNESIANANESTDEILQTSRGYKTNLSTGLCEDGNSGSNVSTTTAADISNSIIQSLPKRVSSYEAPVGSSDLNLSQEVDNDNGMNDGDGQQGEKSIPEHYTNSTNGIKPRQPEDVYFGMLFNPEEEEEKPVLERSAEEIISLPKDPRGVNMYRKPLIRRPRPWLIRQLMGYTLRFLNVVSKLLKSVGRSLSATDRTVLLRQGMTGLTFMNSVFTYDTYAEGWPERVFPPLPLVLQDEDSGCASDQPEYLQGITMHSDEVASVVAPHVLEHQLTFIRGMKALVGEDYTSMFLLMAIMLFDSTQEGLEQPQTVEKIQENYCHLLKQYIGWKFKNGSPQNPGLGRPFNFTPLSSLPQNIIHSGNATLTDEHAENISRENRITGECSESLCSGDISGTSEIIEKSKCCNKRNIYRFERPEGTYYSPPYPPSPVNASSIFPFLMTRLADLKQIAHGYSSTPFLLQGSEVDEIANLVARIEVFMSDIIATEPERDFKDKGGDGGGVGGSGRGRNEDNMGDDMEPGVSKPEMDTCYEEYTKSQRTKQMFDSDTLQHDKIPDYDTDFDCVHMQDFEQDSYSSGDDSNSISSNSAVSIGSSFDDIVGVLEADEGEKLGSGIECRPEEVFESLEIWEKDHSMPNFHEAEEYFMNTCRDNTSTYGKEQINALDFNKSMYNPGSNPTVDNCEVQPMKIVQDEHNLGESNSNKQYTKATSHGENNSVTLSHFINDQSFKEENDGWNKPMHCAGGNSEVQVETNLNKVVDRYNNLDQFERISREQSTFTSSNDKHSEQSDNERGGSKYMFKGQITQMKDFQFPLSFDGLLDSCQNSNTRQMQNYSLWDRIKATGKALLGLDSSGPHFHHGGFWKGGTNMDENKILPEDDGDLESWLNPLDRPDSNSSGYGSTISSPPPLLNVQREFDAYDSGGDWEDLFQKL